MSCLIIEFHDYILFVFYRVISVSRSNHMYDLMDELESNCFGLFYFIGFSFILFFVVAFFFYSFELVNFIKHDLVSNFFKKYILSST